MNDVMSAGVHRIWKDIFVSRLGPGENAKIIDVAGGTGEFRDDKITEDHKEQIRTKDFVD